ncbi:hypothetical protein [Bacillus pretiosus]|uniref:hypothetical protein n=1 Tax=Bacillus pretiosus TaxID=2983392 RepID=UPI003D654616
MQREFRLKDEDLLDLIHFPIQAVFNMVDDERFLRVCEGVGFGEEYGACTFLGDLDKYDIANGDSFEGVKWDVDLDGDGEDEDDSIEDMVKTGAKKT